MLQKVAILGIGASQVDSVTSGVSYKEIMYQAAVRAYADAGISHTEVGSFITMAEDFLEGTSIFDEYVPDQLGAVQKPVHTLSADGLSGLAAGCMLVQTGAFDLVVVEGHSKFSNLQNPEVITAMAMDPIYNRPLQAHPVAVAGLEMQRWLYETRTTPEDCARVVVKNRKNALYNPWAVYGADLGIMDVRTSPPVAEPLHELDIAQPADGAFVLVLGSESRAKEVHHSPVWIEGYGFAGDSPTLESRDWTRAVYAELAVEQAYRMAGVTHARHDLDFAEIDDQYSYKELMHLEAAQIASRGQAAQLLNMGVFDRDGDFPVNPSGGSLGMGYLLEATGLARVYHAVQQLRGEAGPMQLPRARRCLVLSWRGVPTSFGAAVILGR